MSNKVIVDMVNGARLIVPDSLELITTYVLREQGDWFEDEISFVRRLLQPGENALDIGANYGVYTTTMAKSVAPGGKVWAFEPASSTAGFLAESLALNGLSNVTLDGRALSFERGTALLSLNANAELNELVRGSPPRGETETVQLISLDDAQDQYRWTDIDFVKIDAEGEERNILRGGKQFFQNSSPLVQYEVKAGADIHLELVQAFADIGYQSYRLVPGLDALAPFGLDEPIDRYLLNLFSCKPDRAQKLASRGKLVPGPTHAVVDPIPAGEALLAKFERPLPSGWEGTLTESHYGKTLAAQWRKTVSSGKSRNVELALALHRMSRDSSLPLPDRFMALKTSLLLLQTVSRGEPQYLRHSSLGRVAREYGARDMAVEAIGTLCKNIHQSRQINPEEPFLPPAERFESIDPQSNLGNWLYACALEEYERNVAFSSYYSGESALRRLETIQQLGFGSEEMQRRLSLVKQLHQAPAIRPT